MMRKPYDGNLDPGEVVWLDPSRFQETLGTSWAAQREVQASVVARGAFEVTLQLADGLRLSLDISEPHAHSRLWLCDDSAPQITQAMAEYKCPTCQDTGAVDSGGFEPWGAPINVPCPECSPVTRDAFLALPGAQILGPDHYAVGTGPGGVCVRFDQRKDEDNTPPELAVTDTVTDSSVTIAWNPTMGQLGDLLRALRFRH